MKVQGFNHLTLKVNRLDRSISFYTEILGMNLRHRGNTDAYLEWGSAWICLLEKPNYGMIEEERVGVDHVAFSIDEFGFHDAVHKLQGHKVPIVRGPIERGGGWAVNFLDPDGIQFELHTATLDVRMRNWN